VAGWPPTLLFDHLAYGSQNLSPVMPKDFCNTIGHLQTSPAQYGMSASPLKADITGGEREVR